MRRVVAAVALAVALVVSACTGAGSGASGPSGRDPLGAVPTAGSVALTPKPCGAATTPPARWKHVVWVWMENHSTDQVLGPRGSVADRRSPFVNALARSCGVATGYRAITHPSLPNYLAATSGSTHGIARTCLPAQCPVTGRSLFSQVERSGRSWRVYAEDMPARCFRANSGRYVPRHNPAVYYSALGTSCARRDVPFASATDNRFVRDVRTGRLPAFVMVQPNQCHNTHDCAVGTGDAWLRRTLTPVLRSADYRAGRTAVLLVWDEGYGGTVGTDCAATNEASCRMPLVVASRSVPRGTRVSGAADHYALLRTTEAMLGVKGRLGRAATARDLRRAFGLR